MLPKPRLEVLTGLRGIAALTVVIAHIQIPLPLNLQNLFHWHNEAVDLFFILSGFTLFYAYGTKHSNGINFKNYFWARIARIYPLYLFCLVLISISYVYPTVIEPSSYPKGMAFIDFLAQIIGINAWPIIGNGVHWNLPTWSISVEIFCYIALFPLLFFTHPPKSDKLLITAVFATTLVSFVFYVKFFDPAIFNTAVYSAGNALAYWVAIARGASGFICGWLIYHSFQRKNYIYKISCKYFPFTLMLFAFNILLYWIGIISVHYAVFLFPFIVLGGTTSEGIFRRALSGPIAIYIGEISYSIYLIHLMLYIMFIQMIGAPSNWDGRVYLIYMVTLIFSSSLTYYLLERPSRKFINNKFN